MHFLLRTARIFEWPALGYCLCLSGFYHMTFHYNADLIVYCTLFLCNNRAMGSMWLEVSQMRRERPFSKIPALEKEPVEGCTQLTPWPQPLKLWASLYPTGIHPPPLPPLFQPIPISFISHCLPHTSSSIFHLLPYILNILYMFFPLLMSPFLALKLLHPSC